MIHRERAGGHPRHGFSIRQLLLVIAVVVTIVLVCVPFLHEHWQRSLRTQSVHNLKTIALAFHEFHDANKRLPYNGTAEPYTFDGKRYGGPALAGDNTTGSWAFMILPYVGEKPVFANKDVNAGIALYICPGRGRPLRCTGDGGPGAWTDYFINAYLNDPNGVPDAKDAKLLLVGITDGSSNTVMLGHGQLDPTTYASSNTTVGFTDIVFNGGSPGLCRCKTTIARDSFEGAAVTGNWGGPFPQGGLMAMGDATVRMFPYSTSGGVIVDGKSKDLNISLFGGYLTPAGGETVTFCCD